MALDNLGREVELGSHTLNELKDMISSLKVGKAEKIEKKDKEKEAADIKSNHIISNIRDLFEQYTKDFTKEIEEQKNYLDKVQKTLEAMQKQKAEKKGNPKKLDARIKKYKNIKEKTESNIAKAFSNKSLQVHDSLVNQSIENLVQAVKDCCKGNKIRNINPKSATAKVQAATDAEIEDHKPKDYDFDPDDHTVYQKIHNRVRLIEHVTDKFERFGKAILGFNPWDEVSKDIPNEVKFTQEIRAAAFEIKGITKETRGLQQAFEQIGNNEFLTGVDRTKFQETYLKLMRGGIKDQKALKNVTTAQLHTEKQLGLEAGMLQDTFQQWHLSSRLTAIQIEAMGRGLRDVSKYTGLSGEAMKQVVEASKELNNSLKNAGTLNTFSSKNLTKIAGMAAARGPEEAKTMQPLLQALTSRANFDKADDKDKFLLLTAVQSLGKEGRELYQQILSGTAAENENASELIGKGLENIFKRNAGKGTAQFDELSSAQKNAAGMKLNAAYGREAGQIKILREIFGETKSFTKIIKDINAQLAAGVSIEEEKLLLENKRKELLGKSEDILSILDENITKSKTMGEALTKFDKQKNLYGKDLPALGVNAKDSTGIAKETLMVGFKNLNEGLKIAGKEQINIDPKDIEKAFKNQDSKAVKGLIKQLTEGRMALDVHQKTNVDELSGMRQLLNEINGGIRNVAQGTISFLLNSILGEILIIGITLTSIAAGILALSGKLALFAAETYNLFRGGKGVYGRYQTGLLEYIGLYNRDNPDPKIIKYFEKKDAATKATQAAKATKTVNAGDVATKAADKAKITKTIDGKTFIGRNTGKTKSVINEAKAAKSMGFKHILKNIYDWNSKIGDSIAGFINKTGGKVSGSIDKITKLIAIETEKGFINVVSKSWSKTYGLMKSGALKIAEGAVEFGNQTKKAWQYAVPKMRDGLKAVWQLGKTDLTPMIMNAKNAVGTLGTSLKVNLVRLPSLVMSSLTKGIGGGLSALTKVGTRAGSAFAKLLGPVGIALIAIEGFTTAMSVGARAAKIFGKEKLSELSLNQEYAAKSSGLIMGILNGISFGLLGLFAGQKQMDQWTNNLAIFIAKIPLLTIIFGTIVVALEATWGVIKGIGLGIWEVAKGIGTAIWEIGKGLWDGVMAIVNPIIEGLSDVFSAIGNIFSSKTKDRVGGLVDIFRDLGGVIGIVSGPFIFLGKLLGSVIGGIGKALGWILRTVGGIIGFVIKSIFKVIEGFMVFLTPFAEVFDAVGEAVGEIGSVFSELWTTLSIPLAAIGSVFNEIGAIFSELWKEFTSFLPSFGGDSKSFMDILKNIGWFLGKTVGFFLRFVLQPIILAVKIIAGIAKIFQAIFRALRLDFSGAGKLLMSALSGVWDALIYPFKSIGTMIWKYVGKAFVDLIVALPGMLWAGLNAVGKTIYDASPEWLKKVFDGIAYIGTLFDGYVIKPLGKFGGWIAGKWDEWIVKPLGNFGNWVVKQWDEWFIKPLGQLAGWFTDNFYKPIENAITNYIVTPLTNLAAAFTGLVDKIKNFISGTDKASEEAVQSSMNTKRMTTSFADKTLEKAVVAAKSEDKEKSVEIIKETIKKLESQATTQKQTVAESQKSYNESGMGWNKLNPMAWLYKGMGDTFWKEGSTVTQSQNALLSDIEQQQKAQSKIMDNLLAAKKLLREKEGTQTAKDKIVTPNSKNVGQPISAEQLSSIKKIKSDLNEGMSEKQIFIQKYKEDHKNEAKSLGPYKQKEILNDRAQNAWKAEQAFKSKNTTENFEILPNGMQSTKKSKLSVINGESSIDERLVKPTKSTADSIETLTKEATEKHSIYTHDTHVEKILAELGTNLMTMLNPVIGLMSGLNNLISGVGTSLNPLGLMSGLMSNLTSLLPRSTVNETKKTDETVLTYKLTDYGKASVVLQQGILNILDNIAKSNIADIQYPINVEPPNSDEIENSYYYKQNLAKNNTAQTVLATSPMVNDLAAVISKEKAVSEPMKTEIVSSDLGEIADETSSQTVLMKKFVELLEDVKKLLEPKTNISTSSGGRPGTTFSNQAPHSPPNYNRNTVGLVSQTPAKGVVNLGQPIA